ncbi:GNAT family N-acetyltransferase [candidate division KSB1 bacterium]|nr:GNAT family N-acetyltransferase [candidate division KSB1 bacterium]
MIRIIEITDISGFDNIKSEWDSLFNKTSEVTVFQSYEFQRTWWEYFKNRSSLHIIIVQDVSTNKFRAILSLYIERKYGFRKLRFIGDNFGDYIHILSDMEKEDLAYCVVKFLKQNKYWDIIQFNGLVLGSYTHMVLQHFMKNGLKMFVQEQTPAPFMRLGNNWNDFYAGLSKKTRKSSEYYLRRLSKQGEVKYVKVNNIDIGDELNHFFLMHRNRWETRNGSSIFSSENICSFFQTIAQKFADKGYLSFSLLKVGEVTVAMHMGFQYQNRGYYYIPTMNIEYSKYSPGIIHLLQILRDSFSQDLQIFDFMSGNEKYKYSFSNEEAQLLRGYLNNNNFRGTLYQLFTLHLKPVLLRMTKHKG